MGNESAVRAEGCWDIKGQDLRQYYAGFTRRALPDGAIWRLSMACQYLPENHVGYKVWLTLVTGTDRFVPELQEWAIALGAAIAQMKPRRNKLARTYVPSYKPDWGRQAALDGVTQALYGEARTPPYTAQADRFGARYEAYRRIRDFVAGALMLAAGQFESELRLVHREALLS